MSVTWVDKIHAIKPYMQKKHSKQPCPLMDAPAAIPVSNEISDFIPCAHAQSNILHIKYADETDGFDLGWD